MDVVLIVVDALRFSDVGCYGREADITPNIDRIAEEGVVFERAFSQSNYTDVCLSSIMSGKAPYGHGVRHHGASYTEENIAGIRETGTEFLPQTLSKQGYTTVGLDWMGRWHRWGYDEYGVGGDSEPSLSHHVRDVVKSGVKRLPDRVVNRIENASYRLAGVPDPRADCEQLTDMAVDAFDRIDDDLFAFVHYWDVHPPFLPPGKYEKQFTYDGEDCHLSEFFAPDAKGRQGGEYAPYVTGERETLADSKEAYDGTVAWVDEQIGRLYDHLAETGRLNETLFVVTADHGHYFGEHGIFSNNCGLYDGSVRVPLVVHHPNLPPQRVPGLVQHTDLRPTVHDFLDLPIPDNIRGNVLPETREYVFAEAVESRMRMVRTEDWKFIRPLNIAYLRDQYWYDQDGADELYDLNEDSGETRNVADDYPDVAAEMEALLEQELEEQRTVEQSSGRTVEDDISDEEIASVRSNLQSLGYLDER
jgi:arylsulfatase A-like enzyme